MMPPRLLSETAIKRILSNIPKGGNRHRRGLLPRVLTSWSDNDLAEYRRHVEFLSKVSDWKSVLQKLSVAATNLESALSKAGETDALQHLRIVSRRDKDAASPFDPMELVPHLTRLRGAADFILVNVKRSRGHPPNVIGHLVLADVTAIYEWLYERTATRVIDRTTSREAGPFFEFASPIWAGLFDGAAGLSSSMKNFFTPANERFRASPLLCNVDLRSKGKWGVFDR